MALRGCRSGTRVQRGAARCRSCSTNPTTKGLNKRAATRINWPLINALDATPVQLPARHARRSMRGLRPSTRVG